MNDLLPCPFCKGTEINGPWSDFEPPARHVCAHIECESCGASFEFHRTTPEQAKEACREAWNRRQ